MLEVFNLARVEGSTSEAKIGELDVARGVDEEVLFRKQRMMKMVKWAERRRRSDLEVLHFFTLGLEGSSLSAELPS